MPISAYTIRTARVPLGKTDFEVRALTFPDLTAMVTENMPAMIAIVEKYNEAREDVFTRQNISQLAMMVARDFPNFATEIVSACVVGEPVTPEIKGKIALMPAPVLMAAIVHIAKLTLEEAGGLGNLMADFRRHLEQMTAGQSDPSPIPNE